MENFCDVNFLTHFWWCSFNNNTENSQNWISWAFNAA